ncbi:hypothetical protein DM02DRAFT_653786 [Periconia macrospinosa]|uniref:Rhodopsin domain-containing protein n=1 Tax=Periconia macrospinosa TaxID=97972 RepID=A0A2V1DVG0_9PLEO|nr:hypothetical protein DM02DRAFT_653786 [Periconia macrospinosa]
MSNLCAAPGTNRSAPILPPNTNAGPAINAVNWTEASLGILVLFARLYTRIFIVRKLGWDDLCIVLAVILSVIMSALVTVEVSYGFGRHVAYVSPSSLIHALKYFWLSSPFAILGAMFGKIAIALLLLRILGKGRHKVYKAILWTLIVLLLAVHIVVNVMTFSQCRPTWWLWEQFNPAWRGERGTCWNPKYHKNYWYFQGAFAAFSDLVLALFPILIFRELHMDLKLKIALCTVMSLGLVATAAAIVKTVQLKNLATPDLTYNAVSLIYWYVSESWIVVIAACIPTLAPLYFIAKGERSARSYAAAGSKTRSGGGRSRRSIWSSWLASRKMASEADRSAAQTGVRGEKMEGGSTPAGPKTSGEGSDVHSETQEGSSQEGIVKTTRVDVEKGGI